MKNKVEKIGKLFLALAVTFLLVSVVFAQEDVQKINREPIVDQEETEETQEITNGTEQEGELTIEEQLQQIQEQQDSQIIGTTQYVPPTPAIPEGVTQDFVVQIVDYQPKIIRSDLVEDMSSVPIYAQIALMQVNPIIATPVIRSIHAERLPQLDDKRFPDMVQSIRQQIVPGQKLSKSNAGYLVIRLKGGIPESEMPDKLEIPVRVTVDYDIEFTPGIRHETLILSPLPIPQKDQDWRVDLSKHSFWNNAGHLRVTDIRGDRVTGQVYDSRLNIVSSFDLTPQRNEQTFLIPQLRSQGANSFTREGQGKVVLEEVTDSLETRAELLINVGGRAITSRVGEGEHIFEGSQWKVKNILIEDAFYKSGKVILENSRTGEIQELELKSDAFEEIAFIAIRYGAINKDDQAGEIATIAGRASTVDDFAQRVVEMTKRKLEYNGEVLRYDGFGNDNSEENREQVLTQTEIEAEEAGTQIKEQTSGENKVSFLEKFEEDIKTITGNTEIKVDGVIDEITEEAIKRLQKQNNLQITGIPDPKTLVVIYQMLLYLIQSQQIEPTQDLQENLNEAEEIGGDLGETVEGPTLPEPEENILPEPQTTTILSPEEFGDRAVGNRKVTPKGDYCDTRSDPERKYHYGYDFSALKGTSVKAVYSGEVYWIGDWVASNKGDDAVWIKTTTPNGETFLTSYGHIVPSASLKTGDNINVGEKVGSVWNNHLDVKMFWYPKEGRYYKTGFNFDKGIGCFRDFCETKNKEGITKKVPLENFNSCKREGLIQASAPELIKDAEEQTTILLSALEKLDAIPGVQAQTPNFNGEGEEEELGLESDLPNILLPTEAKDAYGKAIINYQRIIREYPKLTIPANSPYAGERFWSVLALRKIITLSERVESSIPQAIEFEYDLTNYVPGQGLEPKKIRTTEIGIFKQRAAQDRLLALQTLKKEYSEVMTIEETSQLTNFFRYDDSDSSVIFEDEILQGNLAYPETVVVVLSQILVPSDENYVDIIANGEYTGGFGIGQLIFANKMGIEEFGGRIDTRITAINSREMTINNQKLPSHGIEDKEVVLGFQEGLIQINLLDNEDENSYGKLYARYNEAVEAKEGFASKASITFLAENLRMRLRVGDTLFGQKVTSITRNSIILDGRSTRKLGTSMALAIDANINSMAKLAIVPSGSGRSVTDFFLHVAIEKRGIQLSPEQMESQANKARNLSAKITKITDSLEETITIWKKACFATSTALFIKNFVSGVGGESFARDKVMTIYKEICAEQVGYDKPYKNYHECFLAYDGEIESAAGETLTAHQNSVSEAESVTKIDGEVTRIDYAKLKQLLRQKGVNETTLATLDNYEKYESSTDAVMLTPSEVQEILFNLEMQNIGSEEFGGRYGELAAADEKLMKGTGEQFGRVLNNFNIIWDEDNEGALLNGVGKGKTKIYREDWQGIPVEVSGDEIFRDYISASNHNQPYIGPFVIETKNDQGNIITQSVSLIRDTEGHYSWKDGSVVNGQFQYDDTTDPTKEKIRIPLKVSCPLTDDLTIRFYENPWKGQPYIAPFPTPYGNGHAKVLRYDTVNTPTELLIRFPRQKGGCDVFTYVRGQEIANDRRDALERAIDAIQRLSNLNDKSPGQLVPLSVKGETDSFRISGDFSTVAEGQCEDFMSPQDCEILFQVCDPVMCPASRFDFGGRWPVTDVVQTGVIGSIMLGMPNFPHPAIPICIPGVRAGLLNWASILDSYADCLDESRETGKTSGVCDRIRSIYVCEMLWREGMAIANAHGGLFDILGKLIFDIGGDEAGVEYMYFQESMEKVSDSVSWFTSEYAAPAFAAFKSRQGGEIGTYLCKAAFFGNVPGFDGMIEELSKPESPPQFFAFIEEIPYSDISDSGTVPQSQYKVFFHIYSGEDRGVFYRVYLSDPAPIPGYFPSEIYEIASSGISQASQARGYIDAERYVSETLDFLAPSGYRQVCVDIDGVVTCGFKQVTTDFGANYLSDLYLKNQLEAKVTTQEECIGGGPSSIALAQLPVASTTAVSESIQGGALQRGGITRVCDQKNPGEGLDESRWKQVGTCGKFEGFELLCWLNTDSVKGAIKDLKFQDQLLKDAEESNYQALIESDVFLTQERSEELLSKAQNANTVEEKIQYANELYQRSLDPTIRAEALMMFGDAFSELTGQLVKDESAQAKLEARETSPDNRPSPFLPTPASASTPGPELPNEETEPSPSLPDDEPSPMLPDEVFDSISDFPRPQGPPSQGVWSDGTLAANFDLRIGEELIKDNFAIELVAVKQAASGMRTAYISLQFAEGQLPDLKWKQLDCWGGGFGDYLRINQKENSRTEADYGAWNPPNGELCKKVIFGPLAEFYEDRFVGYVEVELIDVDKISTSTISEESKGEIVIPENIPEDYYKLEIGNSISLGQGYKITLSESDGFRREIKFLAEKDGLVLNCNRAGTDNRIKINSEGEVISSAVDEECNVIKFEESYVKFQSEGIYERVRAKPLDFFYGKIYLQ